ncbi:hypothetical protein ALC60_05966 [Trachymyrmex zeteki]|uniref:CCHC-type domain-containing protein n=1 Tax=Mycetomoellerius zeteki TaxID=64791 RepID=A0A151X4A1_9HYME|nr:hypothetical protein ALC60_05966 [Trachymyrmex zeteki]
MLRIKFAGQVLPREVFLFKTRHEVRPFISKSRICFACYRVGHIAKVCKGPPRCLYCGSNRHDNEDSCPQRGANMEAICINCKGSHLATSKEFPIVSKQDLIIKMAATENISIADARKIVNDQSGLSSLHDTRTDLQDFPRLKPNLYYNSTNSNCFESPNSFNVLDADDQGNGYKSYADAVGSRSAPYDPPYHGHNKHRLAQAPLARQNPGQ